jgi:DNA-binding transcriptional LysR family regulator
VELRSLRYFLAVADEGSFRGAARSLMITQPPLSREVQRLERELGTTLFDRSASPIRLTSAGQAFAADARDVLLRVGAAIDAARRAATGQEVLRIGFLGAAANGIIPLAVRSFRETYREIDLVLQEHESGLDQLQHLRELSIDMALVREAAADTQLQSQVIIDEPFVAVLPSEHPLTRRSTPIPLEDLAGEPFVWWPRTSAPNPFDAAVRAFARLGLSMPIVQEALGVQTVLGLVSAGIGVSLLPASVSTLHRDGVVTRPLQAPVPTIPLHAVWRRGHRSESVRHFVEALVGAASQLSD